MAPELKYNADYHDAWAWSLAIRGATDEEIAQAFGISRRTVLRWRKQYESFNTALAVGKASADAKVERSLYQRACGYECQDEESIIDYDRDGNLKPVKVRRLKRHVSADVGAICFWLKNRNPDLWRDRHELYTSAIDDETRAAVEEFVAYELTSSEDAPDRTS